MELVISVFTGIWLAVGGIIGYRRIKKDYEG